MKNILLLISIVLLYGCKSEQAPPSAAELPAFPVMEIKSTAATTYRDYPATIEGVADLEIRPQVDGWLEKLLVDEGDYVTAGQALFKINDQPYREQLNNVSAQLSAAEASLANAQLEVDKMTPLVQNKVVSEIQLKVAQAAYKVAKAREDQAKATVATAQINLGYTTIKAPVSGYIGRLPKKQGSLVSRSDVAPLTRLSDVHKLHVYFSLGEIDFMDFKAQYAGKTSEDKINAFPPVSLVLADNTLYPAQGKIDMVDSQFDKNTGAITIRASFPNTQGLLRSGNTGKVRLPLKHQDVILVPQSATIEVQDKVFVFALNDSNKVSRQPITIVGKSGEHFLVKTGIKSGDRIVFNGLDHLQEGLTIAPTKD